MGVFFKALKFCMFFFTVVIFLEIIGLKLFSNALFTPFGMLFFFVAFLNETAMVYS